MATLTYKATYGDWSGQINLIYTASYNPATNQTTIKFSQCNAVYSSRADYQSTSDTNITVQAGDNPNSSGTATLHTEGYGTGGSVTFTGTPSPATITVKHASGTGAKTVIISGATTIAVRPYSGSSLVYAGGNGSVTVSNSVPAYKLSISADDGSKITVNRTASTFASTGYLSNGDVIYYGDKLSITFEALSGFELQTHKVNNSDFTSGNVHTVTADVAIVATAKRLGLVYIFNTSFKGVELYIHNGTSFVQLAPYIHNGTSWAQLS